jgi:RimJ/RimL family protein N-acetyltransferase
VRTRLEVVETQRLVLCWLGPGDAGFILELLNDPSWRQYIGDKGVRTIADAQNYIRKGPVEMYAQLGFGLYLVQTKEDAQPIGICGLIKRDGLEDVDLGFAFLPRFWGKQYAFEAAAAVLAHAKDVLGMSRIVAITTSANRRSISLLGRLGFRYERNVRLDAASDELELHAYTA